MGYAALQDQWIREGDGFLIVYAINSRESFDEADMIRSKIIRILDSDPDDPDVPIVLVGNKCDLPDNERKVSKDELNEKQREWKCGIYETSAKEKMNLMSPSIKLSEKFVNEKSKQMITIKD